jgi:hypothetical protein
MDRAEYWIGKGVDYRSVWESFEEGSGYIDKFHSMQVHLLRIQFALPAISDPLFNQEAIYKTIKGYFHDFKQHVLTSRQYQEAGPLFLYGIDRGSGIWNFLGEIEPLIPFGATLAEELIIGQHIKNLTAKLDFLKVHFGPDVSPELFEAFMKARTPEALDDALCRMYGQRLTRVSISKKPFEGDIGSLESSMIDLPKTSK